MEQEIRFTDIRGWKYRLDEQVIIKTELYPQDPVITPTTPSSWSREPMGLMRRIFDCSDPPLECVKLEPSGELTLEVGFMWDGPSGPTWDTPDWMVPSACHDAIYRLLKHEMLPTVRVREDKADHAIVRKYADDLMYEMLVERGMSKFRASYSWAGVRVSPWAARPGRARWM